jgi:hypothetical protein
MSYFLLNGDMRGGDVSQIDASSLEQGIQLAKDYINGDNLKCASIADLTGTYRVFFKIFHQTNPSKTT